MVFYEELEYFLKDFQLGVPADLQMKKFSSLQLLTPARVNKFKFNGKLLSASLCRDILGLSSPAHVKQGMEQLNAILCVT
jgi:hypothetical protein